MNAFRGYEILEVLPKGGMSTVYKARQLSLDRLVAIKVLPPAIGVDPEDAEKFMTEARITAGLKHQNIVQVYDFGKSEDGTCYFVMEYISGYTVASWIRRKQYLSEENSLLCALSIAAAMDYAWQKAGIVHCDIKPDNVIIDGDGTVKLTDLGLARSVKSIVGQKETDERLVYGTPNYISPEQSGGGETLDCRADIYSLGAMLYHCLTGTMPFEGAEPSEVMDRQITDQIPDPQDINPKISVALAFLIEKMMAKNRDFRQKDWQEVIQDISNARSELLPNILLPATAISTVKRSAMRDFRLQEVHQVLPREEKRVSRLYKLTGELKSAVRQKSGLARKVIFAVSSFALVFAAGWTIFDILRDKQSPQIEIGKMTKLQSSGAVRLDEESIASEKFADETEGTKYADRARSEMQKLEQRLCKETASIITQLDKQAGPLAARNRYMEAASVYDKYHGPFQNETTDERRKKAQALRIKHDDYIKEQEKRSKLAEQQLMHVAEEIAAIVIEDDLNAAVARMKELANDLPLISKRDEFQKLKMILEKSTNAEQMVVNSFLPQKNQAVNVSFVTGPTNVFIRDVQGRLVVAEKITVMEHGMIGVQKNFTARDLTLDEKISRLGSEESAEFALMRTLFTMEGGDYQLALDLAGKTGRLLAGPLTEEIKKAGERRAAQAFLYVLNRTDISLKNSLPEPELCLLSLYGRKFSYRKQAELKRGVSQFRTRFGFTDIARRYNGVLEALTNADLRFHEAAMPALTVVKQPEQTQPTQELLSAITSKIMECNPALRAEEIFLRTDNSGQMDMVEIVSIHLRDIKPLENLSTARKLVCAGTRQDTWFGKPLVAPLDDLSPLKKLGLSELAVNHTMVKDISSLSRMSLIGLNLAHTRVNDLQPLKGMPLRNLDVSFTPVRDLRPLAEMPLTHLNISGTEVSDLSPLSSAPLASLYAGFTRIKDLSALDSMLLTQLSVRNTAVTDISCLRGMPLEILNISGTRVRDISSLQGSPLKKLDVSSTDINDISALNGMLLNYLDLRETGVKDLSALAGMPLEFLNISGNNIKDISVLKGMPLKSLHMRGTDIADLTPVENSDIEEIWTDDFRGHGDSEKERLIFTVLSKMQKLKSINGRPLWMWPKKSE